MPWPAIFASASPRAATRSVRSARTRTPPTLEGELCYRDDAGAICRCWNWRDGERTALTDASQKAFLIIESVDPARADDLAAATDQLAAMVQQYLDADIFAKQIITRDNPTMVIDE